MKPPLSEALSVLLPAPQQTWFLRACLQSGDDGRAAWENWQAWAVDPKRALAEDRTGMRRLIPLLYRSLQQNAARVDNQVLPYLRTAAFYEELRSHTFRRMCNDALTVLVDARVPLMVLRGAALAETAYPVRGTRHCHDLDLLITADALPHAVRALELGGFFHTDTIGDVARGDIGFFHPSRFSLVLHRDLFGIPYYRLPENSIGNESQIQTVAGVDSRILAPEAMLLHILGHASCSSRRETQTWIADAWHVLARHRELNWNRFGGHVLSARLALPLSVMVRYLLDELSAPVPVGLVDYLEDAAAKSTMIEVEAALSGARKGTQATLKRLLVGARGWRARTMILKWMVFPSPDCLRWKYPIDKVWQLPLYYILRPGRFVKGAVSRFLRRQQRRAHMDRHRADPAAHGF